MAPFASDLVGAGVRLLGERLTASAEWALDFGTAHAVQSRPGPRSCPRRAGRAIRGKEVTPFLLSRIVELSGGIALETNKRLLINNVDVACSVAVALAG